MEQQMNELPRHLRLIKPKISPTVVRMMSTMAKALTTIGS
jgi:hypothetical protein